MRVTSEELELLNSKAGHPIKVKKVGENRFAILERDCPFLESDFCNAYDIRPCQCRMFHCGRLRPEDKFIESMVELRTLVLTNPDYGRYKTGIEDEGVVWGNQKGWNWKRAK